MSADLVFDLSAATPIVGATGLSLVCGSMNDRWLWLWIVVPQHLCSSAMILLTGVKEAVPRVTSDFLDFAVLPQSGRLIRSLFDSVLLDSALRTRVTAPDGTTPLNQT